ncbi:MAG: hypothetical protein ACRCZ9_12515, partial [Fusobacteriaceae bacterium]
MIKIKKPSKIRSKSKVVPVGTNCDYGIDNIITLYRSSNDVFYGVIDYLFYRVLGCTPIEHLNINDYGFDYDDATLNDIEENHKEYCLKYDKEISEPLKDQIDKAVLIVRHTALEEGVIKKFDSKRYCEVGNQYTLIYV